MGKLYRVITIEDGLRKIIWTKENPNPKGFGRRRLVKGYAKLFIERYGSKELRIQAIELNLSSKDYVKLVNLKLKRSVKSGSTLTYYELLRIAPFINITRKKAKEILGMRDRERNGKTFDPYQINELRIHYNLKKISSGKKEIVIGAITYDGEKSINSVKPVKNRTLRSS